MAEAHYTRELALDNQLRITGAYDPAASDWSRPGYVSALQRVASGGASDDECQAAIGWAVDLLAANGNVSAQVGTNEWRAIARQQAAIQLELEKRKDERDRGEGDGAPRHPLLKAPDTTTDPLAARIMGPDSTKSLTDMLPDLIKERNATPQTNYELAATVRMFEEYLGEPKPLYRITRQDVRGFKQALSNLPVSATKRFPGLTVPEAIKANGLRSTPFPTLNPRTINDKYLSKLHSLFSWSVKNDLVPDNPATGIKIDTVKDKGKPPRVNFAPSDLTAIFTPERFDTSKPYSEEQWAMLLALFTGTRATELAQTKLDSIRHERGILVIAIEEETKNSASQRIVPVHSTLIELEFEKHVQALRDAGETHLFPDWYGRGMAAKKRAEDKGKVTINHHFPKFIPKRFNVTILPNVGIHDSRKTWHSFRHTFKTGLARAGVPRSMQDDLCGHADHSAGAGYIHGAAVEAMKDAIEKLQFDGFNLSAQPN
jgi:integrase